ncbi:MAG: GTP cyclohydrolase 1 type 2 [Melioribacteraceae bacterium]|nr:MAG: GTP cyclohydrolase 1 type 2 [Melioribacteraceae bacterium]
MIVAELIKHIEQWAPPGAAWEKDNVGLQVGDSTTRISNVFLCLELSGEALDEALDKNCNFIFTHHPFIFRPIKSLDTAKNPKAAIIKKILNNNVTLFSAHTNLDFTKGGVSFVLANKLNLENINFLVNEDSNQIKLVVFIPENDSEKVADAIFKAGGGIIGEYNNCSYRLNGTGTFKGSENSNPSIGTKENFEKVNETRLEVLVDKWKLNKVLGSMLEAHPYEEPAYDVYPLQNKNVNYGFGAIGYLNESMTRDQFLAMLSENLGLQGLRFTNGKSNDIKKVAVCGGSGSDLVDSAIRAGADAFVTADIKYHTFQDAENNILLVDAGHYETEIHVLKEVKRRVENYFSQSKHNGEVFEFSGSTNPTKFYYNKSGDE